TEECRFIRVSEPRLDALTAACQAEPEMRSQCVVERFALQVLKFRTRYDIHGNRYPLDRDGKVVGQAQSTQVPNLQLRRNPQLGGKVLPRDALATAEVDRGRRHAQLLDVLRERRDTQLV